MKINTKSPLPLFELSMILAVGLIAYAAWQLHNIAPRETQDRQRLAEFEQQSTNLQQVIDGLALAFTHN